MSDHESSDDEEDVGHKRRHFLPDEGKEEGDYNGNGENPEKKVKLENSFPDQRSLDCQLKFREGKLQGKQF